MAESKILTRGELYDKYLDTIPSDFIAGGSFCDYEVFIDYLYGDGDYDRERCMSTITTTDITDDFLFNFLDGNVPDSILCVVPLTRLTPQSAENELIAENKCYLPMFVGGTYPHFYYTNIRNMTVSNISNVKYNISIFLVPNTSNFGQRVDLFSSGYKSFGDFGGQMGTSFSFITDQTLLGIELSYLNVSSVNITGIQLCDSSSDDANVLIDFNQEYIDTASKSIRLTPTPLRQIQFDAIMGASNRTIKILGSISGSAPANPTYTFNLKNTDTLSMPTFNLSSQLYGKNVRMAYSTYRTSDNQVAVYTSDLSDDIWRDTNYASTITSSWALSVPNVHSAISGYVSQNPYLMLKVPLEVQLSGQWYRTVLYYPLVLTNATSSSQQYQIQDNGVALLGMSNYHNGGTWYLKIDNQSGININLNGAGHNTTMSYGNSRVLTHNTEVLIPENEYRNSNIQYLKTFSGNATLIIADGDGDDKYEHLTSSYVKKSMFPYNDMPLTELIPILHNNESENLRLTIVNGHINN